MRALVVDDEEQARRRLGRMLGALTPEPVTVIGEAGDGEAALERIAALSPDLVFLDIEMPRLDGLGLAARFVDLPPLIFVTAHEEHALRAFEVAAVDYLLKPVTRERLGQAIARVRARAAPPPRAALAAVLPMLPTATRVVASDRGTLRFFEAREITRFWSSEKYTLFRAEGGEQLTEEPLTSLELRLGPLGFFRVHRAELVRLDAVRALASVAGLPELTLADGQVVRVSRRLLADVKRALGAPANW